MKLNIYLLIFIVFSYTGIVSAGNVSINDAQFALNESLIIINEFNGRGFYTEYINDSYLEALLIFQQATYADVMRDNLIADSDSRKIQARNALKLINWKNISYDNVLYYTDNIKKYKIDAYYLFDSISALDKKIKEYKLKGVDVSASENLFKSVNESFYKGQLKEGLQYTEDTKVQIEKDLENISSINVITKNAKNFFVRYLYWIIFFVVLLSIVSYFSSSYIRLRLLRKKIAKLELEERILDGLMRKTQTERYKENKISGLIYNIRMKKYQERLSEIKQDLPVMKKRLHR